MSVVSADQLPTASTVAQPLRKTLPKPQYDCRHRSFAPLGEMLIKGLRAAHAAN